MREEAQNDTVRETETTSISSTTKDEVRPCVVLLGKYKLRRLLGVGSSAKVYHAINVDTGQSVAVKAISKHKVLKDGFVANIEREISAMHRLQHPHIVKLFEVLATKTKIYLVMEFASGGELFDEVKAVGRLSEDLSRKYFRQLISAVRHCHSHGVFHRDLKLDNLLLDENKDLKVSDFGLSALKDPIQLDASLHTLCGTPAYVAPEILTKKGYDGAKVDVWSCGVVLFTLAAGYLPFNDYNITVLYRKIYRGQFRFPKCMSPDLRNLISRMLDTNPQTRITVDEILQDSWFKTGGYQLEPDQVLLKEPKWEETQAGVRSLNAFDLILFSTGLNMSGLLVDQDELDSVERVISREAPDRIMEKVEEVAKGAGVMVTRKENGYGAKLEARDGNLVALVVVYQLTHELVVIEMKQKEKQEESGVRFWEDKLRPQLLNLAHRQEAS